MYEFYCSCVDWPSNRVYCEGGLIDMIDSGREITRRTFLGHVDSEQQRQLELGLGYAAHPSQGLTFAADWHIRYYVGRYLGERVYWFVYSGIEYVFRAKKIDDAQDSTGR